MITYICYISYYDSETKNTINITADITYTLVKNAANAKLCTVSSDTYVFKYDTSQALVGASQAALTAQVQGVTISKWQYKTAAVHGQIIRPPPTILPLLEEHWW